MADQAEALARGIAREFRRRMCDEYLPRIGRCVELLGEERCWQRPGATGNSVGNLLLHLQGNVRQWILAGIAGEPDRRDRPAEFAADQDRAGATAAQLHHRLTEVVAAAADVVDRLTPDDLLAQRTFQGRYQEPVLAAVLHVMEHCSGHAGQIYAFTKQSTGRDLRFYDL